MKNNYLSLLKFVFFLILLLTSCIPLKKTIYLKSKKPETMEYPLVQRDVKYIQPGDELNIRISSFDDVAYNFYSNQTEATRLTFNNELSIALYSYTVNDSGFINLPLLGLMKVADLRIPELTEQLKNELASYFNQPVVIIKQVIKKVTILGEVRLPGSYIYTKERLTVLDALGMAGDMTINSNRQEVFVIRETKNKIIKQKLDLTSDAVFASSYYFLQPNDVLYVSPRNSASWQSESIRLSVIFSAITAAILLIRVIIDYTP